MDEEKQILTDIAEKKQALPEEKNNPFSLANQPKDDKDILIDDMLKSAVVEQVTVNKTLQDKVRKTAERYTDTKMETLSTNVDTEHKEAIFNNNKAACECYGQNEGTTPIWAVRVMKGCYNVMLAIWIFVGTFTFMPIIFIGKKIQVGLKHTWLAMLLGVLIYVLCVGSPFIIAWLRSIIKI